MLKVQSYILEKGIESLTTEFGISVRKYEEFGIMTLNYSQIDSPKHDDIVKECRALILELDAPYTVVSRTYDRFFNYGECPLSDQFNVTDYVFWEKLDGSIIPVYNHSGAWYAATRKLAFAEGENSQGFCFNDMVRNTIDFNVFDAIDSDYTVIFEFVSPKNRIVKRYLEDEAYLTGVRNKRTGEELNDRELIDFAAKYGFKIPKSYKFKTLDDALASLKDFDPFDEGFVCVNYDNMHRIKIKNPSYVAIAHLRDNGVISPKRIALLVLEQDHEEYLAHFSEDAQFFQPFIDAYEVMRADINDCVEKYMGIENQKEFALSIADIPAKSILFQMRKGFSFGEVLKKVTSEGKLNLLNNYIKDE